MRRPILRLALSTFVLCLGFGVGAEVGVAATCDALTIADIYSPDLPDRQALQVAVVEAYGEQTGDRRLLHDGIVGPATLSLAKRFCDDLWPDAAFFDPPDLLAAIGQFNATTQLIPSWRSAIEEADFRSWVESRAPGTDFGHFKIGRSRSESPVVALLLDEFSLPPMDETPPGPTMYRLTEEILGEIAPAPEEESQEEQKTVNLARLVNIEFPDEYTFRTALRVTAGLTDDGQISDVVALAKTEGVTGDRQPLRWSGSECGCAPFDPGGGLDIVYGLYPFWSANRDVDGQPDESIQEIDFQTLSRVGYFALRFDAMGKIDDPLHWRNDGHFPSFIDKVHQYKSKVDLVIYSNEWDGWFESSVDGTVDALIREIADRVTEKRTDLIDRMKPVISFGTSPRRTLGDGVTVVFDPQSSTSKNRKTLELFLDKLKRSLGAPYFVNLMLSIDVDIEGRVLTTMMRNLAKEGSVDLFVVEIPGAAAAAKLKELRGRVERLPTEDQIIILERIVPLIVHDPAAEDAASLEEPVAYAELNYRGVGVWPVPRSPASVEVLRNQFLGKECHETGTWTERLSAVPSRFCNVICPWRWVTRLLIFLISMVALVYVVLSIWFYSLRRVYGKIYFLVGVVLVALLFLITLLCDPYWSNHRDTILFVTVALAAAVAGAVVVSKRRDYP